jgi:hypothetical protein
VACSEIYHVMFEAGTAQEACTWCMMSHLISLLVLEGARASRCGRSRCREEPDDLEVGDVSSEDTEVPGLDHL